MPRREIYDLVLFFHHETDKAILVSENGKKDDAVWLPKSQIEYEMKDGAVPTVEVSLPTWLASEKKFAGF